MSKLLSLLVCALVALLGVGYGFVCISIAYTVGAQS